MFETERIKEVASDLIVRDNLKVDKRYQWVDVVGIPQRPSRLDTSLYFATHSCGEDGWDNGFDRRPIAINVAIDKGWDLVVDQEGYPLEISYLETSSLNSLVERLYEVVRTESNPYVIGVTGSVGKTTTVAFLEHLVACSGIDVKRFYSKRLTPLGVMCHYINRVDQETPVIVMEYSAYLPDHVGVLSKLLPPNIAFLLNIYNTHTGPDFFGDKKDIFNSKIKIGAGQSQGYINNAVLMELREPMPKGWNGFDVEINRDTNPFLPPTLRTAEMYTVGRMVAEEIGLSESCFRKAFKTFVPKEQRILKCVFKGKNIFFHGETSGGSRLWSWFETVDGSIPWMFVDEVNFGDENPNGFIDLLKKVFGSDKTIVLDTPANRERLPVGANFVSREKFENMLCVLSEGYIIYHKALSTRKTDFVPEMYLKNMWI